MQTNLTMQQVAYMSAVKCNCIKIHKIISYR